MQDVTELDHLAIAADDLTDLFRRYAGDLAGGWVGMQRMDGPLSAQVRFGNGPRLEMLEPGASGHHAGGLGTLVDGRGPGAHHLTFRVNDLRAKVDALGNAGYMPAQVSYDDPEWFEAVLDPAHATGVALQVAEVHGATPNTPLPDDVAVPAPRVPHAAHLDWIGHAVASLDEGRRLFGDILGGTETSDGVQDDPVLGAKWVELEWPEHARMRLFAPADDRGPLAQWLDDRRGGIHHVKVSVEQPEDIPDVVRRDDGTWEIPTERNFGVRLLITEREALKQSVSEVKATGVDLEAPAAHLIPGA